MNSATRGMLYFALLGLILAGAVVGVFEVIPPLAKEGTVAVYFAHASPQVDILVNQYVAMQSPPDSGGPPQRATVLSLELTVNSVQVHSGTSDETGWTEISSATITLDLMKQSGESILLGSTNISEQNITMVRMHIASATATIQNISGTVASQVKVPSGELKIPVNAQIRGQLTTSITLAPDSVHVVNQPNGDIIVRPVLLVKDVHGPE